MKDREIKDLVDKLWAADSTHVIFLWMMDFTYASTDEFYWLNRTSPFLSESEQERIREEVTVDVWNEKRTRKSTWRRVEVKDLLKC